MGTLECQVCFITADADTKEAAISNIDHGANSKKCNGRDENCNWYPKGVPKVVPAGDIDPHRPIQGVVKVAATVTTKKSAPKKRSK